MPRWVAAVALVLAAVASVFAGPLFAGRVLYFRDVGATYYPDFVFVARSLAQGVWPLWHPGADAGAPFLAAYPVHLLLAWVGPRAALALSPPLHVLLAIAGTFALARRLGTSRAGALVAGLGFGLSGVMLGSVLYPVFLASAWMPLAIALFLSLDHPRPWPRAAALGTVLALQVSTLGVEALPQTALAALVLLARRPRARTLRALGAALGVALLLAAPVLLGSLALLSGSARGRGFAPDVAMSYSAPPAVLAEAVIPRFLGTTHAFSDAGFWGQAFFPDGSPFFLSLYVGPVVLLLAALAGRRDWRLWALAAAGLLLALGSRGPLGPVMAEGMGPMRAPVKFFLLATLAIALLSGRGLDRAADGRSRRAAVWPGLLFLALGAAAALWPDAVAGAVGALFPGPPRALVLDVVARLWPAELLATGAAALGAGLAVAVGGRVAALAGVLAAVDLLRVNAGLNTTAPADFYALRPPMHTAVAEATGEGRYRWFSYGGAYAETLHWRPEVAGTGSDVWLYSVDRQALVPRTHVIDGLEGAFDVDRMGLAPEGATLDVAEMRASHQRHLDARLRLANVRWVLSFDELDDDALALRRAVAFPEVLEPLRLYELRRPLPRAFFVARCEVEPSPVARRERLESAGFDPVATVMLEAAPAAGAAACARPGAAAASALAGEATGPSPAPAGVAPHPSVGYELVDPHTVRLTATTPPGFVVVLDGHHPDWKAEDESGASVPVLRGDGRYRAIPTGGGPHVFTLRYGPRWRAPALVALALGLGAAVLLVLAGGVSEFTATRGMGRANLRAGTRG